MESIKGQLTLRGAIVGCVGCVIITASSVYTALKMGALPWPIIFAAVVSLFFLKALSRGTSTLNEANVTHTVMSAGAMVAGGLAFTIPGAWMLGLADQVSLAQMLAIACAGVVLGLACTAVLRKHFVEDAGLEFPIGEAAAQTLIAGEGGGATGKKLFGAMGFAGVFAYLRDALGVIPAMVATLPIPGVSFGIYLSPMMLSVGFLVGTGAMVAWFTGALLGNLGITVGGTALGLFDVATGQGIVSSLGMGLMMGSGLAVVVKDVLPKAVKLVMRGRAGEPAGAAENVEAAIADVAADTGVASAGAGADAGADASDPKAPTCKQSSRSYTAGLIALATAAVVVLACMVLNFPPLVSIVVVLFAFVTTAMSAQSVGQTGIDPMEIFGLIVLLIVAAFADVSQVQLFFVAAVVAVACGLAGDVMNDFKAGHTLGTNVKAQFIGQAIGGILGAVVAVAAMHALLLAYGPEAFGPQGTFVSAQASVVATMVTGVPSVPAFVVGLVAGFVLYVIGLPAMMIGLGVYLPFYMSLTAFLGALIKLAYDAYAKSRTASLDAADAEVKSRAYEESGLVVASGLLGGESIMGILIALVAAAGAFAL